MAPDVLLSRNGRVRCGKCKQIFDGLLSATTLDEFQSASAVGKAQLPAPPPAAPLQIHWPARPEVPAVPIPPMPLEVVAAASPAYQSADVTPAEKPPRANPADAVAASPARMAFKARDVGQTVDFDEETPPPRRGARWPWAFAAALALIVLAGQVLYRYRSELAAHLPAARPYLAQLCGWVQCSVPPLQQPAALHIEASDLQVVDPSQPHIVQLTATLRNRAAVDVGYPALDLVLTDNREHALARRVFVPADYLKIPGAAQSAIAASAEITVRIDMDTSGLPAAGFRLNLTHTPVN